MHQMTEPSEMDCNELVQVPIDGVLDLHNYAPKDLKYLIPDYLSECRNAGIYHVRIIHGKGTGNLRRTVHAILGRLPIVKKYMLAGETGGGWGATMVELQQKEIA